MRILGIDYGDKRVGVAVSDLLGFAAHGIGTFENKGLKNLIQELEKMSGKIQSVIQLIMEISGQTNLLALNSAGVISQ